MRLRERVTSLKGKFDEKSRDLISGFMGLFGWDGRIVRDSYHNITRGSTTQ